MRIKQLELLGFKSFKNRTTLTFPRGITAVVGPNGCGKSNIVDALRWVLGEQSAKHLRGHEMGDVVFAGNDNIAPLGMADVSLLLENTDVVVPIANGTNRHNDYNGRNGVPGNGHRHDWTEIMVSRRYFRSGDAEYLFNKLPCRLRDIVEFFLGTGAGTKAYSIIEQGRVEALINAKPDEIRALVDETAGISLYRSRRLAAERKLGRTRENLSRVSDLLHEMERQLGSLRRQARKADRYCALQDELKAIDLTLLCRAYTTLLEETHGLEERRVEFKREDTRLERSAQTIETERTTAAAQVATTEAVLRELQGHLNRLEGTLQKTKQRQEFLAQQRDQVQTRIASTENEYAALLEKTQELRREVVNRKALSGQVSERLKQAEDALRVQEQRLDALHDAALGHEARVEDIKTAIVDCLTHATRVQHTLTSSCARGEEVAKRLAVLAEESDRLAQDQADIEQASLVLREKVAKQQVVAERRQHQREHKSAEQRKLLSEGELLETQFSEARAARAELRARLMALEDLEEGYDRYGQGVRSVMADIEFPSSVLGVVAQIIDVPHSYERAVAAVLREKLEYMVVTDTAAGVVAVDHLNAAQAGYGSFVPLESRANGLSTGKEYAVDAKSSPTIADGTSRLIDHIDVPSEYRPMLKSLLGDTMLVPDLKIGLQLWKRSDRPHTYVTPRGEVISALGCVSGGSGDVTEAALLGRRREIRSIRQELSQQEDRVNGLADARQTLKQRQAEIETELAGLETATREQDREREIVQREVQRIQGELRRTLDRSEGVGFEQNALEQEREALQHDEQNAQAEARMLASRRHECEARLAAKQAELVQAKNDLDCERARVGDLRVRVAEQRERRDGLRIQLDQLAERSGELDERTRACRSEIQTARQEAARLESEATALSARTAAATTDLESKRQGYEQRQLEFDRLRLAYQECEARTEENRQAVSQLHKEKACLDVSLAEKRVSRDHIEATVEERYELCLPDVMHEYSFSHTDQSSAEARREELRTAIARLGEVNPNAATELEEVEERVTSIERQKTDLTRSADDLQNTINTLNRESRDRFRETLRLVDEKFRDVYARLVDGGKARLVLANEGATSDAGVEIEVQPSGKRLRSMQLLSGGEKALAALSFTFALFLIRPSPFCILDEVDAPLDDANVGRFNQLLREMSETTQIVLITHNKRTMKAADTLYGVTMQEPGVSTVVSVQVLDQVADQTPPLAL